METKILLKANLKRHKGSIVGIFCLIFFMSLSLATVLTVWNNSYRYVDEEMQRLGYGDLTAWVSGLLDAEPLANEITSVESVGTVGIQEIIFSDYEIGGQESDSEGQLITYEPEQYPYKIFREDLSGYQTGDIQIASGEIYISASLSSMYGAQIGDTVLFPIARSGVEKAFVVKGFFEDPFMGSSMIGIKSFLICGQDHDEIAALLADSGLDSLARDGYMLHISQKAGSTLNAAQFNAELNENTSLQSYVEFTHSREALLGFMLTLQNVFTGLLLAFVAVLVLVSMVVLSHSIVGAIEQDNVNMGILKTMGFTDEKLRAIQMLQFLTGILSGMVLGLFISLLTVGFTCRMTVTTTGLLIPSTLPLGLCAWAFALILLAFVEFIWLKAGKVRKVSPIKAIQNEFGRNITDKKPAVPIRQAGLNFWMAVRQLLTGKRRYISVCLTAVLLVFFASLIGRVNAWLGSNGEGLMDAFNPADLHIAAQPMGETTSDEVEQTIAQYTQITDRYMLAMPGVSINGVDVTANVITEPERFHLLSGQTCNTSNDVVLTEFVAADLGVSIGDTVTIASGIGNAEYTVSGIYQCANDLGANIGMSREGYDLIGEEQPQMWCIHYFIENPNLQPQIMQALEDTYGGDVYLHENSWPGLAGILSAMQMMMIFLYVIVIIFVLIVTMLTAGKLFAAEQKDLSIFQTIGFSPNQLRCSFMLRFAIVSLIGSLIGTFLSALLTDPLVAVLMRMEGISNFSSHPGWKTILLPGVVVLLLFAVFAWLAAGKIRKFFPALLISE